MLVAGRHFIFVTLPGASCHSHGAISYRKLLRRRAHLLNGQTDLCYFPFMCRLMNGRTQNYDLNTFHPSTHSPGCTEFKKEKKTSVLQVHVPHRSCSGVWVKLKHIRKWEKIRKNSWQRFGLFIIGAHEYGIAIWVASILSVSYAECAWAPVCVCLCHIRRWFMLICRIAIFKCV